MNTKNKLFYLRFKSLLEINLQTICDMSVYFIDFPFLKTVIKRIDILILDKQYVVIDMYT